MTKWTFRPEPSIVRARVWVLLLIVAGLLCLLEARSAADEDKKKQFLSEYEKPEALLKKKYSGLEFSAIVTEKDTPKSLLRWSKFRLVTSDKAIRLDTEQNRVDPATGNLERHKRSIVSNTALASFFAHLDQSSDLFVLDRFDADHKSVREAICLNCPVAHAPFGFFDLTARDFIEDQDVHVRRFEKLTRDGQELAEVDLVKTKDGDGKPTEWHISFVFDTKRMWAIKEFTHFKMRTTIEYEGHEDGVPKVKAMHRWHECKDGTRDQLMDIDITELRFKKVPESDFTLDAFGLGDKK